MGINLDINLFDNKRHSFRKDAAKARTEVQQAQYRHTLDLINLQITNAENNLFAAIDQAQKFAPRVSAAQQFYKDSYTRYKEGNASYLELVDAQTQLTQTQIQYQLSRYNAWIKWSDWVYASAFLNIP
jgi:outer membrane protein TolC